MFHKVCKARHGRGIIQTYNAGVESSQICFTKCVRQGRGIIQLDVFCKVYNGKARYNPVGCVL